MDITGHTITVKATINRTVPYYRADADTTIDGDVVSNHQDPQTVNYLLRPNKTELTKTNGLDNANTISLKALPAVITSYIITAKNDGCIVTDTVNVTILNLPNIMAGNDTVFCGTGSIQLFTSGGNQYQWSPATGLSNNNISNPVAVINHSIICTAPGTDKNGCENKDSFQVTNRPVPQFLAATITVMPEVTTLYKVTTSTDSSCTTTDTVTVKVNNNLANQYPIASAFSPNGNGINNCFRIKSWDVLKVDFQIYDQCCWRVLFHRFVKCLLEWQI